MSNKTKLQQFAELKLQEKQIKAKIEALKPHIKDIVSDEENESLDTTWGKFELREGRKIWQYSEELIQKEKDVKEAFKIKKRQEELSKVAELVRAPMSLVFTVRKS